MRKLICLIAIVSCHVIAFSQNEESNYENQSGEEKKMMSARLTGVRRTNTTIEKIKNALRFLFEQNLKPTLVNIVKYSKVSP